MSKAPEGAKSVAVQRVRNLISEGDALYHSMHQDRDSSSRYFQEFNVVDVKMWIASARNIIHVTTRPESHYARDFERVETSNATLEDKYYNLLGILMSLHAEIEQGTLIDLETIVVAETLDNFLVHASEFIEKKQKNEAAILASMVLEDAVKQIAKRNELSLDKTLKPTFNLMQKAGIISGVKKNRYDALAGIRDKALHANWDDFDLADAKHLINGVREIIEEHLDQ